MLYGNENFNFISLWIINSLVFHNNLIWSLEVWPFIKYIFVVEFIFIQINNCLSPIQVFRGTNYWYYQSGDYKSGRGNTKYYAFKVKECLICCRSGLDTNIVLWKSTLSYSLFLSLTAHRTILLNFSTLLSSPHNSIRFLEFFLILMSWSQKHRILRSCPKNPKVKFPFVWSNLLTSLFLIFYIKCLELKTTTSIPSYDVDFCGIFLYFLFVCKDFFVDNNTHCSSKISSFYFDFGNYIVSRWELRIASDFRT